MARPDHLAWTRFSYLSSKSPDKKTFCHSAGHLEFLLGLESEFLVKAFCKLVCLNKYVQLLSIRHFACSCQQYFPQAATLVFGVDGKVINAEMLPPEHELLAILNHGFQHGIEGFPVNLWCGRERAPPSSSSFISFVLAQAE